MVDRGVVHSICRRFIIVLATTAATAAGITLTERLMFGGSSVGVISVLRMRQSDPHEICGGNGASRNSNHGNECFCDGSTGLVVTPIRRGTG